MSLSVIAWDDRSERERADGEAVDVERWQAVAAGVLADEGVTGPGELTLAFVDEAAMADLNATYMGETGATDVLSFPLDAEADVSSTMPRLLGDIVICPVVAARNALEHHRPYEDEVALLVVHGLLHVLGMDHAEPAEAAAMVEREHAHLTRIGIERET